MTQQASNNNNDRTMTPGPTEWGRCDNEPQTHDPAPAPAIASNCSHGGEWVLMVMRAQDDDKGGGKARERHRRLLGPR